MGWSKLSGDTALITVQTNKQIKWNCAAHLRMGKPNFIELFYNDETNRLGFREVSQSTDALSVYATETWEYIIDADAHLDNAGISIDEEMESAPQGPTAGGLENVYGGIWWVQL